jgi:simple sugar transport system substrate-binding protein
MSQDYDGVILSHGKDPYATDLVRRLVNAGSRSPASTRQ